jgi:hypothetical protein
MMFDEYGQWVKLVSKKINDGLGMEVGGRNIVSIVRLYLNEKKGRKWWHNEVVRLQFK